jgi:uncharacterized protein (DUF302 family)
MHDGLINLAAARDHATTVARFESELAAKGLTLFARIDHAGNAAGAGLALAPTLLLIFGTARGGTPLMQARQTAGIDLPLKTLIWQDADGTTWITYNDPSWVARRHGIGADAAAPVAAMTTLLAALCQAAAGG